MTVTSIPRHHRAPAPAGAADQYEVARRTWIDLLGRIRLTTLPPDQRHHLDAATIHAVALQVAALADASGARARPDTARIAVELELPYEETELAFGVILALGLLCRTAPPNPYRLAEYRLVYPNDLPQRVQVWSPREIAEAVTRAEQ